MTRRTRAFIVSLPVVLVVALSLAGLAAGARHPEEPEHVEADRPAARHRAAMQREAEALRRRVETLVRAAAAVEEQGMRDVAGMLRQRAEEMEREFHALKERAAEGPEAPAPPAMMHMREMARHHTEMLERLAGGQEELHARVRELTEQVHALREELRELRRELKASRG